MSDWANRDGDGGLWYCFAMAGTLAVSIFVTVAVLFLVAALALAIRYVIGRSALSSLRGASSGSTFEPLVTAAAVADATIAGMPLADAAVTMNDHVFDALDRWVVHSHSGWSLVDYVKEHHDTIFAANHGFIDGLKGYVAESIVGDHFAHLGHNVEFATTTNQPGWDLRIDHEVFQVKAGETAAQATQHHFSVYPDIPVITSPEAAAHLTALHPDGIVAVREISSPHLESTTTHTLHGLNHIAHAGAFHVPIVTVGFSAYNELGLLLDGHTTFGVAITHVGTDAFGVGAGMMAGAKAGVLAGAWAGPHGMAAGGFIGGIVGAVAGKLSAKAIKEAKLHGLIRDYNTEVQRAQAQFEVARADAARLFSASLLQWDKELRRDRRTYQQRINREQRLLRMARRYASFRLTASARWTAFTRREVRDDLTAALRLLSTNPSEAAAIISGVADRIELRDQHAATGLRRHAADFVRVYTTASVCLDNEGRRYMEIIQSYDADSRTLAARLLGDLAERAKSMFSRATEIMEAIGRESRLHGKPIKVPQLALPPAEQS